MARRIGIYPAVFLALVAIWALGNSYLVWRRAHQVQQFILQERWAYGLDGADICWRTANDPVDECGARPAPYAFELRRRAPSEIWP